MAAYYPEGINGIKAQGGARSYLEVAIHRSGPSDATCAKLNTLPGHPSEEPDGLEVCRGFRNAVILEALAVGLVWAGWELTSRLAAWWRAW